MSNTMPRQTGSPKEADKRLDAAFDEGWTLVREAVGWRHAAVLAMRGIGLSAAVLLPLVGLLSSPEKPITQAGDVYIIPPTTTRVEPILLEPTISVNTHIKTLEKTEPDTVNVEVAPLSRLWHRSAFEERNDQLWGLPNVQFKMTLEAIERGCTADDCDARFEVEGLGNVDSIAIENGDFTIRNGDLEIQPTQQRRPLTPGSCAIFDGDTTRQPYVYCLIDGKNTTTPQRFCLWIRRASEPEGSMARGGPELVALDIRWEEVGVNGRCP